MLHSKIVKLPSFTKFFCRKDKRFWKISRNTLDLDLVIFRWLADENSVLDFFPTGVEASGFGILPAKNRSGG